MEEEATEKLLQDEGFELVSPDIDRDEGADKSSEDDDGDEDDENGEASEGIEHRQNKSLEEGQVVRVKVLNVSLPLPRHLTNFHHEHQVVASLRDVEGVVRVVARLSRPGVEALVVEDFGGESLDKWLARDGAFASHGLEGIRTFLALALSITRTLGNIHSRSVVHKDLKPAPNQPENEAFTRKNEKRQKERKRLTRSQPHNLIWNRDTGVVKVSDFGIASVVIRSKDTTSAQTQGKQSAVHHVTTRPVDYRSDFYSLGVTFFELLCGTPPFRERSAVRMMHAHMAKQPPLAHELNPNVPRCLSAVVNRLLAKSVEERYQSSRGLVADLQRCQAIIEARAQADDEVDDAEKERLVAKAEAAELAFVPGQDDVSDVFAFPAKLYGREEETSRLQDIYRSLSHSHAHPKNQVLMVAGYSGVGKTSLVGQLREVKQQAYFISGKYDFNKRDVPYSAIVAAFSDVIHQILAEEEEQVSRTRERLREAVGTNGQLLVNVIPSLELLIGEQPAVELDLGMSEMQNLYNQLFTRLIDVFSSIKPGQPLIMFLDDLHWADQPSFLLIQKIVCRTPSTGSGPLLLVGGYRDNEVSPTHPLWMLLDEFRNKGVQCNSILLEPLGIDDVNRMVADVLHFAEAPESTLKLSELVFTKTKGNPFFTISFLTKLHQNSSLGCWQWDLEKIEGMQYTDNVVEFMAQDLRKLPNETLGLLEVAAFFGGKFDVRDIAEYVSMPVEAVENLLWQTLHQGFVMRSGDFDYRFLHDRMQQAAYECVPPDRNKTMHLDVAQFLMTKVNTKEDFTQATWNRKQESSNEQQRFDIFDVVYHFSEAADLIQDPEQRLVIARLNLNATIKGKNSMAYEMARKVAAQGIEMLPADRWESQHNLAFQLYLERAQCEYLCKNVEAAEQLFSAVVEHAKDAWEKNEVYIQRNQMSTCMQRYDVWLIIVLATYRQDMISYGLQGLAALGLDLPADPDNEMVQRALKEVDQLLANRQISDLLDDPPATDERAMVIQKLISKMAVGYYFVKPNAYTLALATGVKTSIQYGHVAHSSLLYAWYGWVACGIAKRFREAYQWGKLAIDLCEKHYAHSRFADRGEVWEIFYSYLNWLKYPLSESIQGLELGFKHAVAGGNPAFGTGCAYNLVGSLWYSVPLPQIVSCSDPYRRYSEETGWTDVCKMLITFERFAKLLMGTAVDESDEEFEVYIETDARPMPIAQHHTVRMHYLYIMGRYHEALQAAQKTLERLSFIAQFKEEVGAQNFVTPKERVRELGSVWRESEKNMEVKPSESRLRAIEKQRKKRKEKMRSLERGPYGVSNGGSGGRLTGALPHSARDQSGGQAVALTKEEYESYKATAAQMQAKLKQWADAAPCNFAHQYLLVEAERAWLAERERSSGRDNTRLAEIVDMYEKAFTMAIENGFVQDAATAKELSWQAHQAAAESAYCFEKWGARAITRKNNATKATGMHSPPPVRSLTATSTHINPYSSTTAIISSALDLDAVVQATQHLSSKLNLSELLTSLMDLIVTNTGATRGTLLLTQDENNVDSSDSSRGSDESDENDKPGQLHIRARAKSSRRGNVRVKVVQVVYNGENSDLPNRVINYCWRTKSAVVVHDVLVDRRFETDDYVMRRQPRSVLCLPMSIKGVHRGLVYLENGSAVGVFSDDRLRLVKLLTGQLMNTLENALLVDRLRQANRQLRAKNSQLREIDKVKDAHELRTPLNGIIGMASLMDDTDMNGQQQECITDIQDSSETLLSLVNDVLDLSKLKAMKLNFEANLCVLDQCVETCLSAVEAQAAAKDIDLAYILDPAVPRHLMTDTLRLQQPGAPSSSSSLSSSPLASSSSAGSHLPRRHSLPGSRLSRSSSSLHDLPDDDSNDVDSDHGSTSSGEGSAGGLGDGDRTRRRRSRSRTRTSPASRTAEQFYTSARWLTSVVSNSSLPTSPASRTGLALADPDVDSDMDMDMDNDSADKTRRRTEKQLDRATSADEGVKEEKEGQTNCNRSTELHFRVRNSSKVVSEEELEQLFRPFSYGSAVHAFQYGGGGLGLYVCKKLCKMFGGRMWAESDGDGPGFSVHFTIRSGLPRCLGQAAVEPITFAGRRLLIFLRNATNTQILRGRLEHAGAAVTVASTREEFLASLDAKDPSGTRTEDGEDGGPFDAVMLDVASYGQAEVYLLSLAQLVPLVLLATTTERDSDRVREMNLQYSPFHVMHLPLRQARLLEEVQEVLASFDGGQSTTAHMRRDRAWDGYAEAQPHGRRASAPIVRRPRLPVEGDHPLAADQQPT
ncbi:GAF domain containing serine/threonine kinase [Acanthamoeba castellanii str. Neff]|uniref:GAF domain containing serine/threonine kinase n=1 Tax=Acanthamoeba castellanii (strain ATCC 30010 / Neff) TaxID=1257118 RepID=L8GNH5_ACACF|nr:GAF domain containing serine/threonine kinase [Acanthamoeba castellanii str. Neff]ELR13786.1 GAF domain containing serine/threonine kinase [Acanthamoeba castellanii str. Neff]